MRRPSFGASVTKSSESFPRSIGDLTISSSRDFYSALCLLLAQLAQIDAAFSGQREPLGRPSIFALLLSIRRRAKYSMTLFCVFHCGILKVI
jgi:hypothetical protein